MRYFSEFKDLDQNTIRVEVITPGSGETELYIALGGLSITYSGEEIYKPLLKSGCSIDFILDNVVPEFYTGLLLSPEVYVYKKAPNAQEYELFWFGYVTPNAYTQPYNLPHETMTLECVDTLAQAANVDYSYIENEVNQVTFLELIEHILDKVDPNKHIKTIFCSNSVSINNNTNILERLSIVERNFCDELDEAMKGDQCIEEICRFLGFTMFQYKDAYYIIDQANINAGFTSYDRGSSSATNAISTTVRNIYDIGIAGSNGTISLEGLYNKVSIVANTLKIEDPIDDDDDSSLFSDLIDNSDTSSRYWNNAGYEKIDLYINPEAPSWGDWIISNNVLVGRNDIWKLTSEQDWDHYIMLHKWATSNNWDSKYPEMYDANGHSTYTGTMSYDKSMGIYSRVIEGTTYNYNKWREGNTWQQSICYKEDEPPLSLDWNNYFTMSCIERAGSTQKQNELEKFCLKYEAPSLVYKGGAFIVNLKYYLSPYYPFACPNIPDDKSVFDDSTGLADDSFAKLKVIEFPCTLSVGDNYYDGDTWQVYSETHKAKMNDGYFDYGLYSMNVDNDYICVYKDPSDPRDVFPWLRYICKKWSDTYNDWIYISEAEYNDHVGQTGYIRDEQRVVQVGNNIFLDGPMVVWWIEDTYNGNDVKIQVPKTYRDQYTQDKFWLKKYFKNGDRMYGSEYELTNTVSYDSNLNDPTKGMEIRIDSDTTLSGDFKFSIGRPMSGYDSTVSDTYTFNAPQFVVHISSLYVKYSQEGAVTKSNNDIVYYNIINSGYINEFSDIQMKVNTYTDIMTSYSYVLNGDEYLEELTYNNKTQRQELNILEKIVDHYSVPKYVYSNTILNKNITPCSLIYETTLNKTMIITNLTYNMSNNYANITCKEI